MTTWFTSDPHFGHNNILAFCPDREARWPQARLDDTLKGDGTARKNYDTTIMDEGLIERWNAVVKPNDDVYNLGDMFMSGGPLYAANILDRLNGRQHLIYGNHDQLIQKHTNLQSRFASIKDYAEVKLNKRKIVLFHFPLVTWNKGHHGAWHLHGHCHNSLPPTSTRVDIGIDTTAITGKAEHRPYSYEELVEYFKDKQYVPIDHHGDM